jgi:carbamoyl-phosphate synthase large subunit
MASAAHPLARPKDFTGLIVWQKAMALARVVYEVTREFPGEEKYLLVSQMRRAAISVPSNVAEGHARRGPREFLQFLSVASGSLAELQTQFLLSVDLRYSDALRIEPIHVQIVELRKMICGLERALRQGQGIGESG